MAKQLELSYDHIHRDLVDKKYLPVYLLMGEEPFYIDQISNYIQNNVLDDMQKEFDLSVVYGKDTDINQLINLARRYPMMSPKQVVILKEAQLIKDLDKLQYYLANYSKQTILVICYKYGTVDGRKKWVNELKNIGLVYESRKLRDYEIIPWISKYSKSKNISFDEKALQMLADFIGTDLSRLVNEIDKLSITKPKNSNIITPEAIEKNIGISKDFNIFELQDALTSKDILKANRIVNYFADNKKNNPMVVILSQLFNFFSNLMMYHYLPNKQPEAVAAEFKINPFFAKNYQRAANTFNAWKTMQIISLIREADALCKGVDNASTDDGEILRELIYKITH